MTTSGRETAPVVRTSGGAVRGAWRLHVSADAGVSRHAVFRGIPYAAPPVGDARFAAPRPATQWDGVREAVAWGPTAQRRSPYASPSIPEPSIPGDEILTVNVTTPDPAASARLPVLVWIHGGGFEAGSPASPWYVGESFARDGVVTVSLGYRLAVEGFGWLEDAPTNRGVRDWLAALEWVQREIEHFGGDPARVTIAGQSAGAAAVMRLLTMPTAQHLFASALAVSPPDPSASLSQARDAAARIASAVGAERATSEAFQRVDVDRLFDARLAAHPAPGGAENTLGSFAAPLALAPHVDGDLIPHTVSEGLAAGVGADKPLFMGATSHEFLHLVDTFEPLVGGADPIALLEANGLPPATARATAAAAPPGAAGALAQAASDAIFRATVAHWSSLRAATGDRTWVYDFRWESRSPTTRGAAHCVDVPFGFDILGTPQTDQLTGRAPQELADAVHGDWLSLVVQGCVEAEPWGDARAAIVYADAGRAQEDGAYVREADLWTALRGSEA